MYQKKIKNQRKAKVSQTNLDNKNPLKESQQKPEEKKPINEPKNIEPSRNVEEIKKDKSEINKSTIEKEEEIPKSPVQKRNTLSKKNLDVSKEQIEV